MDKREEKIVEAAFRVFSRYGVKRTTMNDIATEAGIVRQTLYKAFANKDEILRATIRLHADRSVAAVEAGCSKVTHLGEQLDIVFKHLVVVPYEQLHATPHADDIISGFNAAAKAEIADADERYSALVERLLTPYGRQLKRAALSPGQLSDAVQKSWVGIKHKAKTKKHLLELLASLKAMILAVAATC